MRTLPLIQCWDILSSYIPLGTLSWLHVFVSTVGYSDNSKIKRNFKMKNFSMSPTDKSFNCLSANSKYTASNLFILKIALIPGALSETRGSSANSIVSISN